VVEQVEEQGLDHVVAVVSERDLGETLLLRVPVERAARSREQSPHIVLFSGTTRLTTL
jgi:hypothetical protein